MNKPKRTKHLSFEEIRRKIQRRRRQLAFNEYPKPLQDFLTRQGMNPYIHDVENRIEHREFAISVKEK